MKIKDLKQILEKYDDEINIMIDKTVDGGFGEIRDFEEYDIFETDDNQIILGYVS